MTAGLLDELADHGSLADLHQALALPLPILVICELLGVPYDDRDQSRAWTEAVGDVRDRARSEQGLADLFEYGRGLVARKRGQRWLAVPVGELRRRTGSLTGGLTALPVEW